MEYRLTNPWKNVYHERDYKLIPKNYKQIPLPSNDWTVRSNSKFLVWICLMEDEKVHN